MLSLMVIIVAAVLAIFAAALISVLVGLVAHGPAAARDAFEHGETISHWWNARRPPHTNTLELRERCALAGRYHPELGIVAVEERASQPNYAR